MRKILLLFFAVSFLFVYYTGGVYAAACTNVVTSRLNASQYSITATGCTPNTGYNIDVASSIHGQSGQQLNATSNGSGELTVIASNLADGSYNISVIDTSQSGFSSPQATLTVGSGNNNVSSNASGGTSTINGNCGSGAINTAIGCIPINNQNALIGFFLRWGIGIGGGIAFLLILVAGFQIMTSRGDPNRLKAGQELMTSAIAGLLLLIFSVVILRIIGFDILNIAAFR